MEGLKFLKILTFFFFWVVPTVSDLLVSARFVLILQQIKVDQMELFTLLSGI